MIKKFFIEIFVFRHYYSLELHLPLLPKAFHQIFEMLSFVFFQNQWHLCIFFFDSIWKSSVTCGKSEPNYCWQYHLPGPQYLCTYRGWFSHCSCWFWFRQWSCLLVWWNSGQNLECISKWNRQKSSKYISTDLWPNSTVVVLFAITLQWEKILLCTR